MDLKCPPNPARLRATRFAYSLPALDHALGTGALTLDQVAAAAEFATPGTDAELARVAVGKAPRAIGLAARTLAPPVVEDDQALYARRSLSMTWTRGRRELVFSGRLPLEQGRPSSRRSGTSPSPSARSTSRPARPRVAAVGRGRARHARPPGGAEGGVRRSPTTLIVHLSEDAPPLLEGAGPISPETAERLACDARRLAIKPSGRDLMHSRVGRCASYAQHRALHKRSDGIASIRAVPLRASSRRITSSPVEWGGDRVRQPHPALRPAPQAPPRPPHPHQRQRRATRLQGRPAARLPPTSHTHRPADGRGPELRR